MKHFIACVMVCCLLASNVFAVGTNSAAYIGGTHTEFNRRQGASEGKLDWRSDKMLMFTAVGTSIIIPYDRIFALEYQRAGKYRMAAGGGSTTFIILPPFAIAALPFAVRKKHFLTIAYKDAEDKAQVIVLELGKEIEKEAKAAISARAGKPINVINES